MCSKRIVTEAPIILLLIAWAWCLKASDEVVLNVVIPFMLGSWDWIHYFFR
jgi:hypothetical protein